MSRIPSSRRFHPKARSVRAGWLARLAAASLAVTVTTWASPLAAQDPAPAPEALRACAPASAGTYLVADARDGETLRLEDGREVRLIGALAPRPGVSLGEIPDWPPADEARRALAALVTGRRATLHVPTGRHTDRYGRLLAHVTIAGADGGAIWLQDSLIRAGLARAYALPGHTACLAALLDAEEAARRAEAGLWARGGAFLVREAEPIADLARLAGHFEIVAGTVRATARTKETTYINFGADWRTDFTASVPTSLVDRSAGGAQIPGLVGQRIRVRGWIERRNGPMISLDTLDQIERLDGGTPVPLDTPAGGLARPSPAPH